MRCLSASALSGLLGGPGLSETWPPSSLKVAYPSPYSLAGSLEGSVVALMSDSKFWSNLYGVSGLAFLLGAFRVWDSVPYPHHTPNSVLSLGLKVSLAG